MRTEINKKRGRPSERSEEARAKGAKRGKNSREVGVQGQRPWRGPSRDPSEKLAFLRFIIVKNAISLQEMQGIPDR